MWGNLWGVGGGAVGGHPDPEIRGEGGKLFKPLEPQFSLNIRGRPSSESAS